jgi:hypothetical protein
VTPAGGISSSATGSVGARSRSTGAVSPPAVPSAVPRSSAIRLRAGSTETGSSGIQCSGVGVWMR